MALFAGRGMGKTTVLLRLRELCLSSAHTAFLGQKPQCDVREFLSYLVSDLDAWMQANRRKSTSDIREVA